jgi:hemolysin activation/secretion protein
MKVPFTDSQSRVVFKFSGQYVEDSVPGTSQFSLTGPYKMRGMPINQYSADRGVYGSVDWVFNGPGFLSAEVGGQKISDTLQPYVFAETAYGDATQQEGGYGTWGYMSGVGLGLKFSLNNSLRASLSYAKVLDFYYDNDPQSPLGMQDLEDDQKFYFDLQYSF